MEDPQKGPLSDVIFEGDRTGCSKPSALFLRFRKRKLHWDVFRRTLIGRAQHTWWAAQRHAPQRLPRGGQSDQLGFGDEIQRSTWNVQSGVDGNCRDVGQWQFWEPLLRARMFRSPELLPQMRSRDS